MIPKRVWRSCFLFCPHHSRQSRKHDGLRLRQLSELQLNSEIELLHCVFNALQSASDVYPVGLSFGFVSSPL